MNNVLDVENNFANVAPLSLFALLRIIGPFWLPPNK